MDTRILGIDLTDNEAGTAMSDPECCSHIPTAICRDRKHDLWYIGEEACEKALAGKGILTDKLLSLTAKKATATIRGVRYDAADLLCRFISLVKETCVRENGGTEPGAVVLVFPDYVREQAEDLKQRLSSFGFPEETTYIVSRSESFLYYVMSQPREIRTGEVGLFDLSDQSLVFYELAARRDRRKLFVQAAKEDLEEAFTISVLGTEAGERLADRILNSAAERLLKNRNFSGIFLTGKGFQKYEWAHEFLKTVCAYRRRVILDGDLFAKGALVRGRSLLDGGADPGFVALCSGRTLAGVAVTVEKDGKNTEVPLVQAGEPIGRAGADLRLLPDGNGPLELKISAAAAGCEKTVRIPLDFLPARQPKTCYVDFSLRFRDEKTISVRLSDAGFGELFPKTDAVYEQEVKLWE